ncbi:MAG: hypothetical protein JW874_09550 [Spirochaetales bacterium]|nr:hypothetical protein [Spirochaetales bacterium]
MKDLPVNENTERRITGLITVAKDMSADEAAAAFAELINEIHAAVPAKKRISYGRYSIVRDLGLYMYPLLETGGADIFVLAAGLYGNPGYDQFVRSLGVQLLTIHADRSGRPETALPILEKAAKDDDWIVRECSAGYVRKLVRSHTEVMHEWYLKMVKSDNPFQRRFACESLRPVADNKWFRNNPAFAFSIIEYLFAEPSAYPRTSAGNTLSDWMRIDREKTLGIVRKLADSGDSNSYWIAARACRNLVKKDPLLVMDLLKTDSYVYKDRKYKRGDYRK